MEKKKNHDEGVFSLKKVTSVIWALQMWLRTLVSLYFTAGSRHKVLRLQDFSWSCDSVVINILPFWNLTERRLTLARRPPLQDEHSAECAGAADDSQTENKK